MDHNHHSSSSSSSQQPPPPPPDNNNSLDTYILQIPRDQIYRVPPPENAAIIRDHPVAPKKKKKHCDPLYCFLSIIAAILLIFIAIVLLVFYILLHLKTPEYSITGLTFKNTTTLTNKHANHSYDITMKVHNPNKKMHILYEHGGNVSLLYEKDKLGDGKYPPLISQEPNESTTIHVILAGSTEPLPADIQKGKNSTVKGKVISLSLVIIEPVELKGVIRTKKRMTVICEFGVNKILSSSSSSSSIKIMSQECRTEFFFVNQR